jgi:glycosyltransferase involved in cell wall biosynthesis
MNHGNRESMVFVTSDLYYVKGFLINQIKEAAKSFEVYLVVNADLLELRSLFGDDIEFKNFNIQRRISIFKDLKSLFSLIYFFLASRPSIVHSTTPKAGLLSMVASFIARVPFRLHTFTGQVWVTKRGLYRYLLKILDRLTAALSTFILCDSHSQRLFLLTEKVIHDAKSGVILNGSIRGVDPNRFKPRADFRLEIRREFNIPDDSVLILYMARFTVDKGALLMINAFKDLALKSERVFLLMVGPDEERLTPAISKVMSGLDNRYRLVNYTDSPEKFFSASDIFCLPSYREGFPMVLLNAACSAVPVVASRIYGSSDVVLDNKTGLLFNSGDLNDLVEKLSILSSDLDMIRDFGENARNFAVSNFSERDILEELMRIYTERNFHKL